MADNRFREARWRRAGATDKQLAELVMAHEQLDPDEQAAESARVDSISDTDLAAELDADVEDITAGNAAEVLTRIGDDRELAAVALSKELAKPRPRKGLVEDLQTILAAEPGEGDG